jgi:L-alanine-DL-glutamate epimerase-like enolase superfamily enzyme
MKIISIDCHVLADPASTAAATSSAQDTIVVELTTDEGLVGIGETDLNAWVARACITAPGMHTMDSGLGALLIGRDPSNPAEIWQELYVRTAMTGRRGALVNALGAIDMALWDIAGKAVGKPCWALWADEDATDGRKRHLNPYASLQPNVECVDEYIEVITDWATHAIALGMRAVKLEATFSGPYVNMGLHAGDDRIAELIASVRAAVGPGVEILIDVQYAFDSVERALAAISSWVDYDVSFVETPLWMDDLDGYAEVSARSPIRIAAGEWLTTRHEFAALVERTAVAVVQPDVGRVGGFTEALRVCDLAQQAGRQVVPHAWKTGITAAATAHLAMVTPNMPLFEFLVPELCESRLRRELLVDEELTFVDGRIRPPSRPGIGVELDRDALARFAEAAERMADPTRPYGGVNPK